MNEHVDQSTNQDSKPAETVEYVGPLGPLPGEIKIMDAADAGWASHSHLSDLARRGEIQRRRASRYNSYIKIEELKRFFGETPPGVRSRKRKHEQRQKPVVPLNITKEERRIIFGEIDSHYLDESRGYAEGWNDEKVAASLKVPFGWVRSVREENFGPEKGDEAFALNEELKTAIKQAEEVKKDMKELLNLIDDRLKFFQTYRNDVAIVSNKITHAIGLANGAINRLTKKQ
jgi:hypothetical protein